MQFGARASKLQVAADFLEGLGHSAFRAGDPVGMLAFDATERSDLWLPARHSRGAGHAMARLLREGASAPGHAGGAQGLAQVAQRLADRPGLVFLVSDFHWDLQALDGGLDLPAHAHVVPLIIGDPAETEPPPGNALLAVHDAENGRRRTLWVGRSLRVGWGAAVVSARAPLAGLFLSPPPPPPHLQTAFP